MITLHHLSNAKSMRILWLLEELGLEYKLVQYQRDPLTHRAPPELRNAHPLGKAPTVEIDGHVMAESGAVVDYILMRHGGGRMRPDIDAPDFARYLELLHYVEGSANAPVLMDLINAWSENPDPVAVGFTEGEKAIHQDYIDSQLGDKDFFLQSGFSGVDVQMTFILQFAEARGWFKEHPRVIQFIRRMEARPAWARAVQQGGAFDLSEFN